MRAFCLSNEKEITLIYVAHYYFDDRRPSETCTVTTVMQRMIESCGGDEEIAMERVERALARTAGALCIVEVEQMAA